MDTPTTVEQFFEWRDAQRRRHRVMTATEYSAWCRVGDVISHPSNANAFPGGLTITFGPDDGILGTFADILANA